MVFTFLRYTAGVAARWLGAPADGTPLGRRTVPLTLLVGLILSAAALTWVVLEDGDGTTTARGGPSGRVEHRTHANQDIGKDAGPGGRDAEACWRKPHPPARCDPRGFVVGDLSRSPSLNPTGSGIETHPRCAAVMGPPPRTRRSHTTPGIRVHARASQTERVAYSGGYSRGESTK